MDLAGIGREREQDWNLPHKRFDHRAPGLLGFLDSFNVRFEGRAILVLSLQLCLELLHEQFEAANFVA